MSPAANLFVLYIKLTEQRPLTDDFDQSIYINSDEM